MKTRTAAALFTLMAYAAEPVTALEALECTGPFKGRAPTSDQIQRALASHDEAESEFEKQVYSRRRPIQFEDARRMNLCGAVLTNPRIYSLLRERNLSRVDFTDAVMSGVDLSRTQMVNAKLIRADLQGASRLVAANLGGADLRQARINETADVDFASLARGQPKVTAEWKPNLESVRMDFADLTEAVLAGANLSHCVLNNAKLVDTNFNGAVLSGCDLRWADMSGAMFWKADLADVIYEPKAGTVPRVDQIAGALNLEKLRYDESPQGLVTLRDSFKKEGFRQQERQLTYAIKKREREKAQRPEALFMWLLFEVTCKYGLEPWRPIGLIAATWVVFIPVYAVGLRRRTGAGIHRIEADEGLPPQRPDPDRLHSYGWAIYFSLFATFNIGWRDLNIGSWLTRLQSKPFRLVATGWLRCVAGAQLLTCLYLLVLWVLTYFGRPFD